MATKRTRAKNAQTKELDMNDSKITERDWYSLKPGDVIWFANGWFKIFDAYASGYDVVTVKLIIPAQNSRGIVIPNHIETYHVRTTGNKATCKE